MGKSVLAFASIAAIGAALAAGAAQAQAASGEAPSGDDIIVTANRQGSQSIQRAALAISAISPNALADKGQGGLADIANVAPSINVQQTQPGVNRVDMRGITTGTISVTNVQDRPLVAIYLDDVPLALQSGNPELKVFDLERIEVIRGPQGTLYGAGSMAGTIRYITAKPDTKGFSGSAEGIVSTTAHGNLNYGLRGIVNAPLSDTLAVRIGGYQGRNAGFIDNTGLGKKNANSDESTQARVAARWTPSPEFTLDASFTFAKLDVNGTNAGYAGFSRYSYITAVPEVFDDNLKIYNVTGAYDFGFATLSASTSYVDRKTHNTSDYGDTAALFGIPSFVSLGIVDNRVKDFSEEVRLVSAKSDRFNWTVGAYYQKTKRHYYQDTPTTDFDSTFGAIIGDPTFNSQTDYQAFQPNDVFSGLQNIDEHQFALFGEATLTLGKFDLTGGLRYFDFKQDFDLFYSGVAGSLAPGQPLTQAGTEKANGFNPRAVIAYRPQENLMLYAEAARGFRYGGVNQPVPASFCGAALAAAGLTSAPLTFGPDNLWSYTVGEKGQFFDRRVTFNVAAFYVDWKKVQTNRNLDCGYYFTQNAGKVRSMGLELESRFKLSDALTIGINGSYTDAQANGAIPNAGAVDGDRVPYFPKYTVAANAAYVVPIEDGSLTFSGDFQMRGNSYTEFNEADPLRRKIPAYQTVNASVTYDRGPWEFSLFGTNLNNSRMISLVSRSRPTAIADRYYYGRPRTFGARAKVRF
ncbi:TonB-dependent receptor [Rhizorhabdus wittichii]|jgi:outer membrane receptor protein involved in Fe transport|uniref:TonB-dependent receptor n=2 Tax=Rhizorhabdus wittichii TaxID=160791 RepID=A0A9J9H990_RHIWR|nr:TonB-dependent receptor [Rhizorhabdus wittichii]ABQ67298.1 TonB-dependent receptor [Rhizorhabdus wittichii RW1]QTH23290.1 TonB-dependent receptor [Rhizorhabdus wittichii]